MARAAIPAAPCAPRLLRAALLLLLLVAAGRRAAGDTGRLASPGGTRGRGAPIGEHAANRSVLPAGAPVVGELRCQCLQTVQGIHLKNIRDLKVTPPGPHCDQTEVIATLKNDQEVCLNPAAPMVKKIIEKMLKLSQRN
uniref:C-X-C motif chemokine n=1 Tax=Catagonus wagneri TaxID=51154 RepID=A0A8C3WCI4_9CETA